MSWQAGDSDAMCDCRPGRVTGPQAQMRRAPGGRALCQEDLESFGLSVEITGDFGPPSQSGPAPQFPLKSPAVPQFGPGLQFSSPSLPPEAVPSPKPALKSPGPMFSPNIRQFVSVSLPQQPEPPQPQHQHQFITSSQFSPVTSVQAQTFPSQQPHPATPTSSQFSSQFSPPTTINSKAPFPF